MLNRAALRLAPRPSGSIARRRRLEGWQCRQDGTAGTLRRCRWTHRSWRCSSWARWARRLPTRERLELLTIVLSLYIETCRFQIWPLSVLSAQSIRRSSYTAFELYGVRVILYTQTCTLTKFGAPRLFCVRAWTRAAGWLGGA